MTEEKEKTVSEALAERQRLKEQTAKVRKTVKKMIASAKGSYPSSGYANSYPEPQEVAKPKKDATVIVTAPDEPRDKRMVCRVIKTSPLTVKNTATGEVFAVTDKMKVLN